MEEILKLCRERKVKDANDFEDLMKIKSEWEKRTESKFAGGEQNFHLMEQEIP